MTLLELLRNVDVFESLPQAALERIATLSQARIVPAGEVVYQRGDEADAIYVLVEGRVSIADSDFGPGEMFGELALLSGEPRPATATAVENSRILVLDRAACEEILAAYPRILRNTLNVVSQRAMQANRQLLADETQVSTARPPRGRAYAIFSPRGGSGKTTLSINLALRLARQQHDRVAIVDLDLLFGEVAPLLNAYPAAALGTVPPEDLPALERRDLSRHLGTHPSGLHVLVGATEPEEGERVTAAHVRTALGAMKRQFSTILIDCNSTFGDATLIALEMSERVIVLCTPELTTLRDVRECQRIFERTLHMDRDRLWYAFTRPQPQGGLSREQFETAFEQPMTFEIPHGGEQPSWSTKSPFARAIDEIARRIEAETPDVRTPADAPATPSGIGRAVAGANRVFGRLRR